MNDNGRLILSAPKMGRNCVLFEVEHFGFLVRCSVSEAAIQDASGVHSRRPGDLLMHFAELRERITRAALAKLNFGAATSSILHVWASDLDDDPMPSAPAAAMTAQV